MEVLDSVRCSPDIGSVSELIFATAAATGYHERCPHSFPKYSSNVSTTNPRIAGVSPG